MNIAILGSAPALLPFVRLIAGSADHHITLTHICGTEELAPKIMQLVPAVVQLASWEDLLQEASLKMVIVAGANDDVLIGAKQLATADVPLMLLPAAAQDSTFIYELSLIQDANHVSLVPYIPLLDDPAIDQLRQTHDSKPIENAVHIQLERTCHSVTNNTKLLSRKEIEHALLNDVVLLRNVWGDYNQITAIYSGKEENQYSLATVTMSGLNLPEVVWTLKPALESSWKLTSTSTDDSFVLQQQGSDNHLVLHDSKGNEVNQRDRTKVVAPSLHALLHPQEAIVSWGELIRSFETVDATRRSIKRRRTIDLYFETTSERSIFKTQMTAIGCSLLVITLFLFVSVLFIGSLFHPPKMVMYLLRGCIFLPLFIFLAMQLFIFITRPASSEAEISDEHQS